MTSLRLCTPNHRCSHSPIRFNHISLKIGNSRLIGWWDRKYLLPPQDPGRRGIRSGSFFAALVAELTDTGQCRKVVFKKVLVVSVPHQRALDFCISELYYPARGPLLSAVRARPAIT